MSETCQTCVHWGGVMTFSGKGPCYLATTPANEADGERKMMAIGGPWRSRTDVGALYTAPDFGCNQFKPKLGQMNNETAERSST